MATAILRGIVRGEFGKTISLTLKDSVGTVQNISAYDGTKQTVFKSPKGNKLVTCTAAFATDGSDGKVTFSFAEGDITESGNWEGTVKLNNVAGTKLGKSEVFIMEVTRAVK